MSTPGNEDPRQPDDEGRHGEPRREPAAGEPSMPYAPPEPRRGLSANPLMLGVIVVIVLAVIVFVIALALG